MRKFLLFISILPYFFLSPREGRAQSDQTVPNGAPISTINFPGTHCVYQWTNSNPDIGIPASGTGSIPAFVATNYTGSPITATIKATAIPTNFAYITNQTPDGSVTVLNTIDHTITTTLSPNNAPTGIAISPDGSHAYVTNNEDNTVTVINTVTNTVENTFQAGISPFGIVVSPDGGTLYVTNMLVGSVTVINSATGEQSTGFATRFAPAGIAISPDGNTLYVANSADKSVSVITVATRATTVIQINEYGPYGISISPDGKRVYVANSVSNNVSVIDAISNTLIKTIPVGSAPYTTVVSPDGSKVYVSNSGVVSGSAPLPGTVSVIDVATSQVTTIAVGEQPEGMSFTPDGSQLYVCNTYDHSVSIINVSDDTVAPPIPVGSNPVSFGNFVAGGAGCSGSTIQFTITVTPLTLPPVVVVGDISGTIITCQGEASGAPNMQEIDVSGNSLTDDIIVTAPLDFEVSLSPGGSFGNSLTLPLSSQGKLARTPVYIRAAASAPAGAIQETLYVASGPSSAPVFVSATVRPSPLINQPDDQTFKNGQKTKAIDFTGTGNTYTWTNDQPGIGLPTSGAGNIGAFTAVNKGATPLKATITVTPVPKPPVQYGYITNQLTNNVSVINITTQQIIATLSGGTAPTEVTVSPDGSRVYVSNTNLTSPSISVINPFTNKIIAEIPCPNVPDGLCVSPDGQTLYVSCGTDIQIMNTITNKFTGYISIGEYPSQIAISPDGSTLYITNGETDNTGSLFYIASTVTETVIKTIHAGMFSHDVCASPDGSRVYVANAFSQDVSVINTATNSVETSIPTGGFPWGMCINSDGSLLYVVNSGDANAGTVPQSSVVVIDTKTNKVIQTIQVGWYAIGISITPDDSELYVANTWGNNNSATSGSISVIDTKTNKVTNTITTDAGVYADGSFIPKTQTCTGSPVTFTITIDPSPVQPPGIPGAPPVIPNAFTPNGDGINDNWDIQNLATYANCIVKVFNRWGQTVYSSIGYGTPWDGTYKGSALPGGTYYYIINLEDGSKELSGYVAVIR